MSRIYLVGLGPGGQRDITPRAMAAMQESAVIAGYTGYVELVRELLPGKQFLSTPMRGEVERCRMALERAAAGDIVSMVCSGDSGVYGMAGLVLQLAEHFPPVEVEVVPGITAACSGAALLGAPLMHDFAVISLSDLLTPWMVIEKRLRGAALADFVICLYNPSSRKRADYLQRACDILLEYCPPQQVCGVVRSIGREGEEAQVLTLGELRDIRVDMFTTVFVGNSQTQNLRGRMVTPRGYAIGG